MRNTSLNNKTNWVCKYTAKP